MHTNENHCLQTQRLIDQTQRAGQAIAKRDNQLLPNDTITVRIVSPGRHVFRPRTKHFTDRNSTNRDSANRDAIQTRLRRQLLYLGLNNQQTNSMYIYYNIPHWCTFDDRHNPVHTTVNSQFITPPTANQRGLVEQQCCVSRSSKNNTNRAIT